MKPQLQTRLAQQLALTPQLRQAIRLLQLSAVELEQELDLAIESNPLLERLDEAEAPGEAETAGTDEGANAAEDPDDSVEPPELDYYDGEGDGRGHGEDGEHDGESALVAGADLQSNLSWQLGLTPLSARDQAIGAALIDAIDEDGYLRASLDDIRAAVGTGDPPGDDEIEAVLRLVQHFDPLGCGARDPGESLRRQLDGVPAPAPGRALAQRICEGSLEALARLGPERLARQLGVEEAAMRDAVALLRTLDPHPGRRHGGEAAEYIAPDAIAYRQNGVWKVALIGNSRYRLGIQKHYARLIGQGRGEQDQYLRGQLQEARWLIRSLHNRQHTVLRVARAIVRQQSGFLEHGAEAMRPLTLQAIAAELGLHESTISRATTRKYLRTPRGTFEFKHFFSAGLGSDLGGEVSATAIQAMLRRLIEAEDPAQPLSDAALAERLKEQGVAVARRTVAKYRELLQFPSSHERLRLR